MEDCKLEINLEDTPGALSQAIDIIAKNRGNLFSVSHLREQAKDSVIPVIITLQAEKEDFQRLVSELECKGVQIVEKKWGSIEDVQISQEFIRIGHVIDTDIKDTIHGICDKDVMVTSLDINLKSLKDPSSAFVELGAKSEEALEKATEKLQNIADKKGLLLIAGIEK
jgi:ACT domain-containing protein